MPLLSSLEAVERLYAERGGLTYGEGVTQLEHALQCARLARAAHLPPSLIVAALLHDVGHLLEADEALAEQGVDDRHEVLGARALKGLFGEAVTMPIALHVIAKRYLCWKDAGYFEGLSAASQQSLRLQGGSLTPKQARAFEGALFWQEAVALRLLDDHGKQDEPSGAAFADFMPMMRGLLA